MKYVSKIAVVVASGVLLSGCSLFVGDRQASLGSNAASELASAEAIADVQLEVGRKNLAEGNLHAAASYLGQARAHESTRAAATNALAVVYVRLGRLDVAQRYFAEAVEMEPDNARYITNLARIERDVSFAHVRANGAPRIDDVELALAAAAPVNAPPVPGEIESSTARSNVIHIRSIDVESQAPASMEVVSRRPVIQLTERDDQDTAEVEPVREASRVKVVEYPVRIEI